MQIDLKCNYALQVLLISFCFSSNIEASESEKNDRLTYSHQDSPNLSSDNPMKGFSKFLFFVICPTATKKGSDQVLKVVDQELERVGKVNKSKILVQTEQGKAVDLKPLAAGATLIYEIENLKDPNGQDLGVIRASLNLTTAIQIEKTKEFCSPYIWSSNCFLKGSVDKNLEDLTRKSLRNLLDQFSLIFISANSLQPIFDLQEAEPTNDSK